ncbi:hypothetical protein ACQJBY_003059 [Aegilops geniculata]
MQPAQRPPLTDQVQSRPFPTRNRWIARESAPRRRPRRPRSVRRLPVRLPMARFRLHWLEAMLPLGIIGGFLCIMGNGQYYIHRAAHGRPKHIGNDMWDVAMERRDKKLVDKPAAN